MVPSAAWPCVTQPWPCEAPPRLGGQCTSSRVRRLGASSSHAMSSAASVLDRHNGCHYFRCYGKNVGPMWTAFGARLLARCGQAEEDLVIAAACRTFDMLHSWLSVKDT
jgi:heme oxygenase